jgi:hypothetical protein
VTPGAVRILALALVAFPRALYSQPPTKQQLLPFPGPVEVLVEPRWPESLRMYSDSVVISIRGVDGYRGSEACFSWESKVSAEVTTVVILGRMKCAEPPLLRGDYVPSVDIVTRVPHHIRLLLPGDSAVVLIFNDHLNGIPGYRVRAVHESNRVRLPHYGVSPVRLESVHVYCTSGGYPTTVCEGFVGSLSGLANVFPTDPRTYTRRVLVPPFYNPYGGIPDSMFLARAALVDLSDDGGVDRILEAARGFTAYYRETLQGRAQVQVTTWRQDRFICAVGVCKKESMNRSIGG